MTHTERNRPIVEEFRANGGKVGGYFAGVPLLLLTTTGAQSGEPRTSPLAYQEDDHGRPVVFGTNAGADHDPQWYRNLVDNPRVTVEIGTSAYQAVAIPLRGEEHERLHARMAETSEAYAGYIERTDRTFPIVVLHRVDEDRRNAIGLELLRIHDDLRRALGDLLEAAAFGTAPTPGLMEQLRERCLTVCGDLESHHGKEEGVFPRIERHHPGVAPVLDELRRQHRVLAGMRAELEALYARTDMDPEDRREEISRLAEEIDAHFADEERRLIPVLDTVDPAVLLGRPA
ncbi:nitroreductase family deazaflavin-dependent oxidoreductase [Actinomadura logoneensis]|uniref:Nitroreductase family deazaflavin-dependent oxidoreductase n=1 Tax=Actinomadura logoneensis TaxID=2293572 RepID=A0A372JEE0_9ACTN|nr:nitroreductase/quinone reductase family protein [Actinomadura logoneensis]RFU38204.1 nitroreductase family deazaflavin-dependent oxidoreductase [Actinomadura logoneensis]